MSRRSFKDTMTKTATGITAVLVLLVAAPALAQDDSSSTTVAPALISEEVPDPAVPITQPVSEEPVADWTYRYLVPTLLVLGGAAVVVTVIQYFTRVVRTRYRVVE